MTSEYTDHFNEFHKRISLDETQVERIQSARARLLSYVRDHDALSEATDGRPFIQGSYKQNTGVLPIDEDSEFDVDLILPTTTEFVGDCDGDPATVLDTIHGWFGEHGDYEDRLGRKDRCIRLDYAGDFHVDLTPTRPANGLLEVPDRHEGSWEPTNPKELTEWIDGIQDDSSRRFKRAMKYLKRWRDRTFEPHNRIPSVAFTVWAGVHNPYTHDRPDSRHRPLKTERADSEAAYVTDLFIIMAACLDDKTGHFPIPNPAPPLEDKENLARDWASEGVKQFCRELPRAARAAEGAYEKDDPEDGVSLWRHVFGDDFPEEP